jgi:DNA-binding NarL/FixJ family response regulator
MARPRVMLADDHRVLGEACRKLLEPYFDVVGIVTDGRALLVSAPKLKPDVVVLDVGMPLLNGLEAGKQLRHLLPQVKLVFLTVHEDPDLAKEAFQAGASGYLLKTSAASELVEAIKKALLGKVYVTPSVTRNMEELFVRDPEGKHPSKDLSPRQREVLQLLAEGHPMKAVAFILKVSPRTVAFHKYRMMEQLGLKSTAELIQFAVKHHIVVSAPEFEATTGTHRSSR